MTELATVPLRDFDPADELVVVKEGTPDELGRVRPRTLPRVTITEPGLAVLPDWGPPRFAAYSDFVGINASADLTFSNSGTSSSNALQGPQDGGIGWVLQALGTTATGRAGLLSTSANVMQFGLGRAIAKARMRMLTRSDATNSWTYRCGFIDNVAAESTDGAFFRYAHSQNGGRFQAVTRSNNVETAADTGVLAEANTTYRLLVDVNADGTSVDFYIDGTLVATITTNIPNTSARLTGYGFAAIRSAGTANLNACWHDYFHVEQLFTGRE